MQKQFILTILVNSVFDQLEKIVQSIDALLCTELRAGLTFQQASQF